MPGVELIAAALAAGASVGLTTTASAAVGDAYAALKSLLRMRLAGRQEAATALEADETDVGIWQARLAQDLIESGASDDEQVLAAACNLLAEADPATAKTFNINVQTNNGAIGDFAGPVTFNQGAPIPPVRPGAV